MRDVQYGSFFWGSFHWGSQNRVFGVSILNLKVKDGNSKNQKMDPNLSNYRTPHNKKPILVEKGV